MVERGGRSVRTAYNDQRVNIIEGMLKITLVRERPTCSGVQKW